MTVFTQALIAEKYGLRLTMDELSEVLRVARGTIYNQISAGTFPIPTYVEGKSRFADYRDVAAHIDASRERAERTEILRHPVLSESFSLELEEKLDRLSRAIVELTRMQGKHMSRQNLCDYLGIHRNTLAKRLEEPGFPRPRLGKWLLSEVLEWQLQGANGPGRGAD